MVADPRSSPLVDRRRVSLIDDRELISAAGTDEFGVGSVGVIGSHYY
jgi:hypothetical protein